MTYRGKMYNDRIWNAYIYLEKSIKSKINEQQIKDKLINEFNISPFWTVEMIERYKNGCILAKFLNKQ